MPRGDRRPSQRRHLHAAEPARHARDAVEHRRRALGRRGHRSRAADRRRSGEPTGGDGAAHSARGIRSREDAGGRAAARRRLRIQLDARHALRHAAAHAARAVDACRARRRRSGRWSRSSLKTGERLWEVPLGCVSAMSAARPAAKAQPDWGSPNLGGPIATAGGLVFIGAALDRSLHAYDIETGRELWRGNAARRAPRRRR